MPSAKWALSDQQRGSCLRDLRPSAFQSDPQSPDMEMPASGVRGRHLFSRGCSRVSALARRLQGLRQGIQPVPPTRSATQVRML